MPAVSGAEGLRLPLKAVKPVLWSEEAVSCGIFNRQFYFRRGLFAACTSRFSFLLFHVAVGWGVAVGGTSLAGF